MAASRCSQASAINQTTQLFYLLFRKKTLTLGRKSVKKINRRLVLNFFAKKKLRHVGDFKIQRRRRKRRDRKKKLITFLSRNFFGSRKVVPGQIRKVVCSSLAGTNPEQKEPRLSHKSLHKLI